MLCSLSEPESKWDWDGVQWKADMLQCGAKNLINSARAGSSAIDLTQLGHRKCFGTK